jgi:factor associated with neutral sphingomyelinase activation
VLANRSHNDLSQYPIFPWILHSYDCDFDLRSSEMFRDLSKPIGAINKHRLRKLKDLYELQLKDKTLSTPAHLYPTHYSTPGYVSYFLIRKIPEFIVRIQNGVFSPSDRIFRCVESAYLSSMNGIADFKELIP